MTKTLLPALATTRALAFTRQVFATPRMDIVRGLTLLRAHAELTCHFHTLPAGSAERRQAIELLNEVEDELLRRLELTDQAR